MNLQGSGKSIDFPHSHYPTRTAQASRISETGGTPAQFIMVMLLRERLTV